MTDANSCTATTTGNITQPSAGSRQFVRYTDSVQRRQFNGDGERHWRHRALQRHGHVQPCGGTYSFTVTDANGCTATTTGNITEPDCAGRQFVEHADPVQRRQFNRDGERDWRHPPYSGTGTFSRSAGTYSFTVTDANSCTATTTGNITQPTRWWPVRPTQPILCNGGNSIVTVSATGGTAPYSGTGTFSRSCGDLLVYGDRCAIAAPRTTTATITQPDGGGGQFVQHAILCNGGSSMVTVSATGGTAPYTGTARSAILRGRTPTR